MGLQLCVARYFTWFLSLFLEESSIERRFFKLISEIRNLGTNKESDHRRRKHTYNLYGRKMKNARPKATTMHRRNKFLNLLLLNRSGIIDHQQTLM